MEIKTNLVIMTSILAVALIATAGIPSPFVNILAQEGAITPEGINATMTGQNDTSTTSGDTVIPETIVTNATLVNVVGNNTDKPMNATLAYAQGNDTMTSNATLAYAQGNDTMTSNATLAYAQGNDTMTSNATLAYAQGNDTMTSNATLAYAQGNDTMTSNATLPMSLIGNGTS